MAREHIMKLQRPLASTEANPPVLVYNQDRGLTFHVYMDEPTMQQVFGRRNKVYCKCRVIDGKQLEIGDEVEDREW